MTEIREGVVGASLLLSVCLSVCLSVFLSISTLNSRAQMPAFARCCDGIEGQVASLSLSLSLSLSRVSARESTNPSKQRTLNHQSISSN